MKRVIIVHCWGGTPNYCWYPWAKKQLEAKGFKVEVPALPNTDKPQLSEWLPELSKVIGDVDQETYIITHSLGMITALHYLANHPDDAKIAGMVVVAGNYTDRGYQEMANFFTTTPDLDAAKRRIVSQVQLIYSDDDPWVPQAEGHEYEKALDAHFTLLHGMGHFSGPIDRPDSCTELPEIIAAMERLNA